MFRFYLFLALLLFNFNPTKILAEKIAGSEIYVKGWEGAAYAFEDGSFSHCAISMPYVSDFTLLFSLTRGYTMNVGLSHSDPIYKNVDDFQAVLYIDRRPPIYATAEIINDRLVLLQMPDIEGALWDMKKGKVLRVTSYRGDHYFNLDGTFKALDATYRCADKYFHYAGAPSTPKQLIAERQLYQISASMISDLQLSSFNYVDPKTYGDIFPAETVIFADQDAGVLGFVTVVPTNGSNATLKSTDGVDIGFMNSFCDGETGFTTRNLALENFESRELRMVCAMPEKSTDLIVTKTKFQNFVLYTGVEFNMAKVDSGQSLSSTSEALALRAAKFVVQ